MKGWFIMKYYLCKTDLCHGFRKGFVYQYFSKEKVFINDKCQMVPKSSLTGDINPERLSFYFTQVMVLPNMEIVPFFSEGQVVRMKALADLEQYYGVNENGSIQTLMRIPEKMKYLCGLEAVITKIKKDGTCKLIFKDIELQHKWTFSLDMISPVENLIHEKYKTAQLVTFTETDLSKDKSLDQTIKTQRDRKSTSKNKTDKLLTQDEKNDDKSKWRYLPLGPLPDFTDEMDDFVLKPSIKTQDKNTKATKGLIQ